MISRQTVRISNIICIEWQLLFIVLRLLNVIHWNWFWILSPLWVDTLMSIVLIVVYAVKYRKG